MNGTGVLYHKLALLNNNNDISLKEQLHEVDVYWSQNHNATNQFLGLEKKGKKEATIDDAIGYENEGGVYEAQPQDGLRVSLFGYTINKTTHEHIEKLIKNFKTALLN